MAFFGFKFEEWNDEALICKPNIFWISKPNTLWNRYSKKPKVEHHKLEMYTCPDIFYTDLESDINIPIDERYHVSRGQEENSAILFVQKYKNKSDDKIYPQKYVENIVFQISALRQRADANLLTQTQEPDINLNPISIEEELIAYGQTIKLTKPYEKFRLTFFSTNICGKRKSHKVYICRESIRGVYGPEVQLRFDEDYDEAECRKRIKIRVRIWNDANFKAGPMQNVRKSLNRSESFYKVREVNLLFVHCPRMMPTNKNDFVYLASNLHQHSVTFYMRTNDPVEYFDVTAIINRLNPEKIVQDNRRTRYTRYPLERERRQQKLELARNNLQQLEENINSVYSSVQTPTTIAKVDGGRLSRLAVTPEPVQLIQKRRLVEDIVIKYSQIKTMKLRKE